MNQRNLLLQTFKFQHGSDVTFPRWPLMFKFVVYQRKKISQKFHKFPKPKLLGVAILQKTNNHVVWNHIHLRVCRNWNQHLLPTCKTKLDKNSLLFLLFNPPTIHPGENTSTSRMQTTQLYQQKVNNSTPSTTLLAATPPDDVTSAAWSGPIIPFRGWGYERIFK